MCLPIHRRDPRTRALFITANLSLTAAVLALNFSRRFGQPTPGWLDALTGFLMGLAIALQILVLLRLRRSTPSA